MIIKKELIRIGLDCENSEQAIRMLAQAFLDAGVVKESFIDAVVAREKVYPTGLPAAAFDIAIPHTVSEHVIEPAMAIGVLKHPVVFQQMGSPEIELHPQLIFMLAISDPKEQIALLRRIMKFLQSEELLNSIKDAQTTDEVIELLVPFLGQ